jgi:ketosteroid isomerase-like protein
MSRPSSTPPIGQATRRAAIAAGMALPFAGAAAAASPGDAVARLLERARQANAAFLRGDMQTWYGLASPIAPDFTLMQPFGGPPSHGFDGSAAHLAELALYFRNGVTRSELVAAYGADDVVVLVLVERQHGEVGGLPDQEWSLRVTQVYRRRGETWEFVHRHADPLVRDIGLERAAALARGPA